MGTSFLFLLIVIVKSSSRKTENWKSSGIAALLALGPRSRAEMPVLGSNQDIDAQAAETRLVLRIDGQSWTMERLTDGEVGGGSRMYSESQAGLRDEN